jgi:hypothetical protein
MLFFLIIIMYFASTLHGSTNSYIDQYFNNGATVSESSRSTGSYHKQVFVDLYDNIISSYFDSSLATVYINKYKEDGTFDSNFNNGGTLSVAAPGSSEGYVEVSPLDGSIFILFISSNTFELKKKKADGSTDTTFGASGSVSYPTAATTPEGLTPYDSFVGMKIDSAGRLLLMHVNHDSQSSYSYLVLWKFTSAGVLDGSVLSQNPGFTDPSNNYSYRFNMQLDADQNIYVAGFKPVYRMICYKFSPLSLTYMTPFGDDPSNDNYFQTNEFYDEIDYLGTTAKSSFFIDSKRSKIYIIVYGNGTSQIIYKQIVLQDGTSDDTIGDNGSKIISLASLGFYFLRIESAAMNSDGHIILSGRDLNSSLGVQQLLLIKIKDGALDETFNNGSGYIRVAANSGLTINGTTVAIDSGDGLVASVIENNNSNNLPTLRRFLVADHVDEVLDAESHESSDSFQLAYYTNSIDKITSYLGDSGSSLTSWTRADGSGVTAKTDFTTALKSFLEDAIDRATKNSFTSCMAMKYKKGLAKRECNQLINSTNYTTNYSTLQNAVDEELEKIATIFAEVRNELLK